MNRTRIVLADDHTITREGIRQALEREEDLHVVAEAAHGETALQLARSLQPDVMVLDIRMPRMTGVEVVRALNKESVDINVIVLTGYDDEHYVHALLRLGIKGYLLKSASAQEVVEAIRTVQAGGTYIQPGAVDVPHTMAIPNSGSDPTERELEVLRLVAEGLKNRGIADRLHVSERTVHYHLRNLFKKLKVTSRSELVFQSRQRGLIG